MASPQGGRGNKSIANLVEEWQQQGFSEQDIRTLLKEAGYKKSRISQLMVALKGSADDTEGEDSPLCQRCGFPHCKCKACKQTRGKGKTTNAKEKHTCYLQHYGPHPYTLSCDPICHKRVPAWWMDARDAAWANLQQEGPVWHGAEKLYKAKKPRCDPPPPPAPAGAVAVKEES